MNAPPTIRHEREGLVELTVRQWAAVRALSIGYQWIDRRDGAQLFLLGLAYKAAEGFKPTQAALALLEPWYEDMAR